jgi:hypothetical protein
MNGNLKRSLILSALFWGLIRLHPIWERYPGGFWNLLIYIIIASLFVTLIIKIIKEIVQLIKKRHVLKLNLFFPIITMLVLLFDSLFNPLEIDLNKIYGEITFRACYEGTQNQATFYLRENNNFDIHWTGAFFSDNFFTGNYIKNRDTIILEFETNIPRHLDDTLIIKDEYIYRLQSDSLIYTHFYLGDCKGLN